MSSNQSRGRGRGDRGAQRGSSHGQGLSGTQRGGQSYGAAGGQRGGQSYGAAGGGQRGGQSYGAAGGQRGGQSYGAAGGGQRGGQSYGAAGGQRGGQSYGAAGGGQRGGQSYGPGTSGQSRDSSRGAYGGRGDGYRGRGDAQRGAFRGSDRGGHRGGRGGGDRGGYRGGRSRPDSPVRNDVRGIAQNVEIEAQPEKRGTIGTAVELITNHYPIEETEDLTVCHYDIDISLRRRDGKGLMAKREQKSVRNDKQMENKQIIDKMAVEWPEVPLRPNHYAYDGHKILFTVEDLGIGEEEVTREVTITLDGFPEQTYEVKVKFARNIPMNEFSDSRQVMDIALRDKMQRLLIGVGRNLFNRNPQNSRELVGENCSIGFGHHQSIQKTQSGLTVNVDRVTTIFRGDGPLIRFIERELDIDDITRETFNQGKIRFLTSRLRDLKIFTEHIKVNNVPQKRKGGIEAMSNIKPYEASFETEPGTRVTVEQHFQTRYGITLRFRELPLIIMKGGTRDNPKYLPIEVCTVYPNQTLPKALINRDIQSQIVESTNTQTPLKRFDKIHDSLQTIDTESQELMQTFGLRITPNPIKLTGRELPSPRLIGDNRQLKQTVDLKTSIFVNLSPTVASDLNQFFNNFFNHQQYGMLTIARGMGFNVNLPRIEGRDLDISSLRHQMESFDDFIKGVVKGSVQIVFVCIPDVPPLYELIKHLSENVYGIITQCIKDKLFMNTKPGYFNNFLLKTNAKLNGQNQALNETQSQEYRPRVLTDIKGNTMIIGADVTHPGIHNPLANERVISSIAAVVGSYDKDFTKFIATVSAQPANTEYITDFGVMFETLLRRFHQINGKYPQNIILFRDGVSESQLDAVRTGEMPQIEGIYRKLKIPKPKITGYVVQKRHHTRIFLPKPTVDRRGNENFNMKSGTVVDHTITNPDLNEFHLCSHTGRLGTSRHAKYVVIRNDHNLSPNQLQLLAFSMCFTYCRCLTPISIPIPVKYADLAAYRAKQHIAAQNTIFEAGNRNESDDQRRAREARNIRRLNETMVVDRNIQIIPYYA